jgi:integrase
VKEKIEAKIAAGEIPTFFESSPPTVKQYGESWSEGRKGLVADDKNEAARLVKHVYPRIGHMLVRDVKPRHVIALVKDLRMSGKLAPRTVHHTYGILHVLFRGAVIDEIIAATPCVLTKTHLGKKEDKDPEWRAGAVYSREELELLISSEDVPWDRQILYGLEGVGGLRHGEAAGERWRNYDPDAKPLGRLVVARSYDHAGTKTSRSSEVPVHPVLAAMLAEWKLRGWEEMVGKGPTADDLIIPSRTGELRSRHHSRNKLLDDLKRLGLRHRRGHDLRRPFITLARVDGARKDLLEIITHSQRGNIIDIYTSMPWASLCEEVAKLKIERRIGKVLSMPKVVAGGGNNGGITGYDAEGGDNGSTASSGVTAMKGRGRGTAEAPSDGRLTSPRTSGAALGDQPREDTEETMVEAPGIEPSARGVANGRKRTQADGNGRGSGDLNGKMRPFATAIRPDATASVYQVYQAAIRSAGAVTSPWHVPGAR